MKQLPNGNRIAFALIALVACDGEPVATQSTSSSEARRLPPAPSGLETESDRMLAPMFRGEELNEYQKQETHSTFLLTMGELRSFKRFLLEECGVELPETAGTFVSHGASEEEPRSLRAVVFRTPPEDALEFAEEVVRVAGEMCGPGKRWEGLGAVQKLPREVVSYGAKWTIGSYKLSYHRRFTNEYGNPDKEWIDWLIDPETGYVRVKDVRGGIED